jgi:hypothetical protein
VVISAGLAFLFVDLRIRSAPEFTAPNDEGVFEETALFQVGEQGSAGAVRIGTKPAMAILDLDNDGDLDIVTNEFHDGPMVLRSNLSDKRGDQLRWVGIKLVGSQSNRDGLGAVVKVTAGGKSYSQANDGVTGYLSHGLIPLYFGLGDAGGIEKIEVTWPSGKTQKIEGLELGKTHTVREP